MTTGPGWQYLEELGPEIHKIRTLRYEPDELFDDVPDENLAVAMRWLRAASYSARQGERKLRRILEARHPDDPTFDPDEIPSPTRPEQETNP